jgi:curved DNA-binding protein
MERDPRQAFESLFGEGIGATGAAGGAAGARRGRAAGRQARPRAGVDLEQPVEIGIAEAYRGTTLQVEIRSADGQTRRLEVKIPPGVRTGSRVRVRGQGGPGENGGKAGDLFIVVGVRPDRRFERRGDDLHTQVQAPLEAFLIGGEARVPTPDGRTLALSIPAGTPDGRVFRMRGQGMPKLGAASARGDMHAAVHVVSRA